ncbi:transcriptional regulator, TetR family [Haloplanus vescus]|uniref:Transcriptional regulator, TetR family n=1 Tax=Haloplanus vescus TaxID=555874 RepID=A0A1H3YLB6_9EURY|nr:TetR/AcrR family transcriptional regulator [Haloplanus vescus]SEA12326.1 transcriptional regulator, TetR family [Haloplanus vescus]
MTGDDTPTDDIMCATYRALCRHGYANLTMQDIADEWSKSKAALHYHYDTKRGLLLAFLDHLFDAYTDRVADDGDGPPRERLQTLLADALDPPRTDASQELRTALFEVKAQAPHDDGFRERLARFDRYLHDEVRGIVTEGVETGAFRADIDPETTATLLVTLVNGARSRRVALDDEAGVPDAVRAFVDDHLVEADE